MFQVPYNIAAGGVSGVAIVFNSFTGWPEGTLYLLLNLPLLVLGFFHLRRWRFLFGTVVAVVIFSVKANIPALLDQFPLTDNILLSAIYGGIVGGIGVGIFYQSGGTLGRTGTAGRILQRTTSAPSSQVYLYTDSVIILIASLVFGWEIALYSLLTLFLHGLASDYTLERPSSVRSVTIITDKPHEVSLALLEGLNHSVSRWQITGAYTGKAHSMLMCTVYRSQVKDLK